MNLAMLTSQIPLIELGVITSFVLMHFARIFLGLSQSSIAGTFFIVVCTILLLLPFNSLGAPWSLPLVAYVRGVTGELSIITMLLILFTWSSAPVYRLSSVTPLIIALTSILFYPFALGLTMFDPYSWGYGSIIFCRSGDDDGSLILLYEALMGGAHDLASRNRLVNSLA